MIVKAYVVLAAGIDGDAALAAELQDHVKRAIAPYKYPRAIEFIALLPKTGTGKLTAICPAADGSDRIDHAVLRHGGRIMPLMENCS